MNSVVQIQKLIDTFAAETRKHYVATLKGDWKQTNKHAEEISTAFQAITQIGEEARNALLQLAMGEDEVVASMAATYSLKYAPNEAVLVLNQIARRSNLLGFEAAQALQRWQERTWQLE